MAGPVSAFAARRANQTSATRRSPPTSNIDQPVNETHDELEASTLPRKKRRHGERPKSIRIQQSATGEWKPSVNIEEQEIRTPDEPNAGEFGPEGDDYSPDSESSQESTPVRRLSSFVPTKSNVLNETETDWTIRLHPNDDLALLGQYDIWIRSGAISILGAVFHDSPQLHRVFAPSTHSIPSIKALSNPYGTGNPPVIVTLQSSSSRLRMLKQLAPKFGRIWNGKGIFHGMRKSFVNIQSSGDDPHKRPLRLLEPPSDWQIIVSELIVENEKRPRAVMVCGPKGAGKSSICRIISNSLLSRRQATQERVTRVAFLDLDPGQPEFSPPGELSLVMLQSCILGPPFTHPTVSGENELIRAHHFGYLSPKEDFDHYYNCALDLYNYYQQLARSHGSCPLVVNCSGWIQGSGLELLANLIRILNLTDVIYMSTSGPEEVVETLSKAATQTNTELRLLSSQGANAATRTAADLRLMQTVSYFHLDEPEDGNLRWNPYPLTSQPPLVVHFAGAQQAIHAVMILGDAQNPEFISSALDGCIVSIAIIEIETALSTTSHDADHREARGDDERVTADAMQDIGDLEMQSNINQTTPPLPRTPEGIPYIPATHHTVLPLSPAHSYSLGQALISSIDTHAQAFHILTPIPPSKLAELQTHKIILIRGHLDTPTWAYAEEMEFEKERKRRRERELGISLTEGEGDGDDDDDGVREWVQEQPWASVLAEDRGRSGSGKVRRVRRDLRYRGQGL